MQLRDLITKVDPERFYSHILNLEGPRHPLDNPERLAQATDYIRDEMSKSGLEVVEHFFRLEGLSTVM